MTPAETPFTPHLRVRSVASLTAVALLLTLGPSGHVLAASSAPAGATGSASGSAAGSASGSVGAPTDPAATPASSGASSLSAQAIERFKAKDYDAAVRLFEQAYAADPNPNYLFNIGRVYEEKGDIRSAVDHYQRFVKEPGVDIGSRELAVQRLRVLKAILNETEAPAATPAGPEQGSTVAPPADPGAGRVDNPDPKKTMRLGGYALIGVGGVSMLVGGIFGGLTLGKKNDLDDEHRVSERQSLAHQGKTFAVVSDVTLFTGAALLVTGVVLAVVARKPRAASRSALAPSVGRNHAGLSWTLRF